MNIYDDSFTPLNPSDYFDANYTICMVWHGYRQLDQVNGLVFWPGDLDWKREKRAIIEFMVEFNDARVKPVCLLGTEPDVDNEGEDVEGTGGRSDLLFLVHKDDEKNFYDRYDNPKWSGNAPRWLFDIYGNDQGYLYPDWVEGFAGSFVT